MGSPEAASAGTVSRQLVKERPLLRPAEVLELVPGLVVTQHSGAGKANQYFLRGFNLDHGTDFATALDGVPLNLPTHAHGQGYTDLNFLVPELIDRVDYAKGPYFASRGDFASAGAADLRYAERLPASLAQLTGGSFGYLRALAAGSPEAAGGRLLYALEVQHDDGPWTRPDDYRRLNGVLRFSRPAGDGTASLTAMAYRGTWNGTDQVPLRAVEQGRIGRYGTLDSTSGGDTFRASLAAAWRGPAAGGALEATAWAVRYRLRLFSDFTWFLAQPLRGDQFEQSDDRWAWGAAGRWSRELETGPVRTAARAGWEARVDRILPVALFHTAARRIWETVRRDDVVQSSGGLFAEAASGWTPWLRTVLGARADAFRFDVSSSRGANSGIRTARRASPKATAVLGPWASTELFANWGLGFHSNDARGTTMRVDAVDGVTPVSPVTPLVRTRGDEIGIRTELLPAVQASLSLWELVMGSELLFTGDAGTTAPSRPSRRVGVEGSARWRPLPWLLLDLDLALSRARFTSPDPAGPFVPGAIERTVSAGAIFEGPGPWSAAAFVRHFGPRPLTEDGSVRSAGSTLVSARAGYRLTRHLHVGVEALNLLDGRVDDISYWYASRLPGEPAAGREDVHFHPAVRRTWRASLAATY